VTVDKRSKAQDSNVQVTTDHAPFLVLSCFIVLLTSLPSFLPYCLYSFAAQLPTSSIWALLALAEVLGATDVHNECYAKLQRMVKYQPDGSVLLPQSATSIFSASDAQSVLQNLAAHFQRFGERQDETTSEQQYRHEQTTAAASTEEMSCYNGDSGVRERYGDNSIRHSSASGGSVRSAGIGSVSSGVRSVLTDAGYDTETLGTAEDEGDGEYLPAPPSYNRYVSPLWAVSCHIYTCLNFNHIALQDEARHFRQLEEQHQRRRA
jgi:hypothetical protein